MKSERRRRRALSHEGRLTWLTLAPRARPSSSRWRCFGLAITRAKVQWTLTLLIAGFRPRLYPERARTCHSSAANDDEPARRVARRRLLDSRPGRPGRRRARAKPCSKSTRSAKRCACSGSARSKRPRCCARSWPEIDVAVFTFDPERRLRLVNRAGENLLGQPMDKLLGRRARDLGLEVCLDADEDAPLTLTFPGGLRALGRAPKFLSANEVCRTSCWS